uniref:Uncharacterized protein n=1 Tax=Surirella sp. TaxID=1526603 RepID=A0A2R4A3M2_9STRA|nr:hypothetical protein [Surirella sp.]
MMIKFIKQLYTVPSIRLKNFALALTNSHMVNYPTSINLTYAWSCVLRVCIRLVVFNVFFLLDILMFKLKNLLKFSNLFFKNTFNLRRHKFQSVFSRAFSNTRVLHEKTKDSNSLKVAGEKVTLVHKSGDLYEVNLQDLFLETYRNETHYWCTDRFFKKFVVLIEHCHIPVLTGEAPAGSFIILTRIGDQIQFYVESHHAISYPYYVKSHLWLHDRKHNYYIAAKSKATLVSKTDPVYLEESASSADTNFAKPVPRASSPKYPVKYLAATGRLNAPKFVEGKLRLADDFGKRYLVDPKDVFLDIYRNNSKYFLCIDTLLCQFMVPIVHARSVDTVFDKSTPSIILKKIIDNVFIRVERQHAIPFSYDVRTEIRLHDPYDKKTFYIVCKTKVTLISKN